MAQMVRSISSDLNETDIRIIFAFGVSEGLCNITHDNSGFAVSVDKDRLHDRLSLRYETSMPIGHAYASTCVRCASTLGLSGYIIGNDDFLCHACCHAVVQRNVVKCDLVKLGNDMLALKLLECVADRTVHVRFCEDPHDLGLGSEISAIDIQKMLARVCSWLTHARSQVTKDSGFSPQGLSREGLDAVLDGRLSKKHLQSIYHSVPLDFLDSSDDIDRYLLDVKKALSDCLGVDVENRHAQVFINFVRDFGTKFHLDQGPGVNIAMKLGSVEPSQVLAHWLFVYLSIKGAVEALNKAAMCSPTLAIKFPDGLFRQDNLFNDDGLCVRCGEVEYGELLSVEEMMYLAEACPKYTRFTTQCHGDVIVVPVGVPHIVRNSELCVKVAFDFSDRNAVLEAVVAHAVIGAHWFGPRGAPDYMNHAQDVKSYMYELVQKVVL